MSSSKARPKGSRSEAPPRTGVPMSPTAAERHEMISVAAYYRAEHRGFASGCADQDWLEAEIEIDRLIAAMIGQGITREAYERAGLRHALRLWAE